MRALEPWGEGVVKQFVQEALDESLKVGMALSRLRTAHRHPALLAHPGNRGGEPPEIFCFLGSSRLEEPLIRYDVTAVFHGHAHRGRRQGETRNKRPVYNVSLPALRAAPGADVEIPIVEIDLDR